MQADSAVSRVSRLKEFETKVIEKYLNIPYRLGGRDDQGLDCYGLIIAIYRNFGVTLIDVEAYEEKLSARGKIYLIENYYKQWVRVDRPVMFDVVLFADRFKIANHGGIVLSDGRFIHGTKCGVLINRISEPQWIKRFEGFYRFKNDYFKIHS